MPHVWRWILCTQFLFRFGIPDLLLGDSISSQSPPNLISYWYLPLTASQVSALQAASSLSPVPNENGIQLRDNYTAMGFRGCLIIMQLNCSLDPKAIKGPLNPRRCQDVVEVSSLSSAWSVSLNSRSSFDATIPIMQYLIFVLLAASSSVFASRPKLASQPLVDVKPASQPKGDFRHERQVNASLTVPVEWAGFGLFTRQSSCSPGYCRKIFQWNSKALNNGLIRTLQMSAQLAAAAARRPRTVSRTVAATSPV